mgnify:CR=1 FL=1
MLGVTYCKLKSLPANVGKLSSPPRSRAARTPSGSHAHLYPDGGRPSKAGETSQPLWIWMPGSAAPPSGGDCAMAAVGPLEDPPHRHFWGGEDDEPMHLG